MDEAAALMWLGVLIAFISVSKVNGQACLPGWVEVDGRCFQTVNLAIPPSSHDERRRHCLQRRGDLAKIEPLASFQNFLTVSFGVSQQYFIGLTDIAAEGDYRWVKDITVPSEFPWAALQPNGATAENCVIVSGNPPVWSDASCNLQLPFVCERLAENPPCGSGPFANRIVGGSTSPVGAWPWQGSLLEVDGRHFCGATLISEEWAVTAAHCQGADRIFFGDTTQATPSESRHETEFTWFSNPLYNPVTLQNDLSLIYLHSPVTFSNVIRPACLYSTTPDPSTDASPPELTELRNCYITGWGDLLEGGNTFPDTLQEARVTIFSPMICVNYGPTFVERVMLCAGDINFEIDVCEGDSGGPLICEDQRDIAQPWTLAGVVSFSAGCARQGFPSVFARVSTLRSFIDNTRNANTLFRCADTGKILLNRQACDNIVDCDDYSDEIGCNPLLTGQTLNLISPKFGLVTNFITRQWIYFPGVNDLLTVTITSHNIPTTGGSLTVMTTINDGAANVPNVDPDFNAPFTTFSSGPGEPIVISMDKTSIDTIAGFQGIIASSLG